MKSLKKGTYECFLFKSGFFYYDGNNNKFNNEGTCFTLLPEKGKGNYWFFECGSLFSIFILDFVLYEDLSLERTHTGCLSVSYHHSFTGENLKPYCNFKKSGIKSQIHCNRLPENFYQKNIPIRCTGIAITPEYCKELLQAKNSWQYENLKEAFSGIDGINDFPELVLLLMQIRNCRFTGISAKLYYESKVMEAVSLIMQKNERNAFPASVKRISPQDVESIASVTAYIDDNFACEITLEALSKIACMGTTKLKYTFKAVHKCTISDYIIDKRLSRAKHLISSSELNINQISKIIGYKKAGSFTHIFRKNTGLLPNEYRKLGGGL